MPSLIEGLEHAKLVLEAVAAGEYCCVRHGLPYVTPSLIGEQAFCEQRLHYRLSRGETPEEVKPSRARRLLQVLLGVKRGLRPGEEEAIISPPLASIVDDVPVVGRPPALAVRGGCVKTVLAAKLGRRIYPSDEAKLAAYAALVHSLGLSCSESLKIAIVVSEKPVSMIDALKLVNPFNPRPAAAAEGTVIVRVYGPEDAARVLSPLLAYWRGERGPRPRPGSWCSRCPYASLCPYSAAPGSEASDRALRDRSNPRA